MSDPRAEFQTPPEPVPEEEIDLSQPEPVEEPALAPEPPPAPEPPKEEPRVPLAALQEARREAREAKQAAAGFQQQLQTFQQQLAELRAPKPAPEPEIVVPDKATDYAGWLEANQKILERRAAAHERQIEEWQSHQAQQRQAAEEQQREAAIVTAYHEDASTFASQNPDFGQVYNAWTQGRLQEWVNAGYPMQAAKHHLKMEERAFVVGALQSGMSPSEQIYAIAKRYAAAPAPPPPLATPPRDPATGQFTAPTPPAPPPVPRSLSQARGVPGGQNSVADLLSLSPDEFHARTASRDDWRKMAGG